MLMEWRLGFCYSSLPEEKTPEKRKQLEKEKIRKKKYAKDISSVIPLDRFSINRAPIKIDF